MNAKDRETPGGKTGNIAAYLGMQPGEFFSRLAELKICPPDVSISEAAWNLLLKPLYEKDALSTGNGKLAEVLYEAASALKAARLNGAEFEVSEAEDKNRKAKIVLEVYMDANATPTMEIGIAGERELKKHPERLEKTDTPPVYFMLRSAGCRM